MLLLSHQVSACGAAGGQLVGAVQGAGGAVGGLTIEVWMAVLSGLETGLAHIDHAGALGPLNASPSRSLMWPSFISQCHSAQITNHFTNDSRLPVTKQDPTNTPHTHRPWH